MVAKDNSPPIKVKNWATKIANGPFRYPQPHMQASFAVGFSSQVKQVEGPQHERAMMMVACIYIYSLYVYSL